VFRTIVYLLGIGLNVCSFEDGGVFACLLFSLIEVVFRHSVSKIGAIITDFVSIFFCLWTFEWLE
jgi:hypothetical protein